MTQEEILEKITPIFRTVFEDDSLELTSDMSAKDVEKWDSVTNVVMLDEVEKLFSIKFGIRDVMGMKNVGNLVEKIQQHTAA